MAKERSGAGDPARTLELLWREPDTPVPGADPDRALRSTLSSRPP